MITKGESGDNPDFRCVPHFAAGDSRLPFSDIDFGIRWIEKQKLLEEILSTNRKDGPWKVPLADCPEASLPKDLCFRRT